jgi:hypothetical protein
MGSTFGDFFDEERRLDRLEKEMHARIEQERHHLREMRQLMDSGNYKMFSEAIAFRENFDSPSMSRMFLRRGLVMLLSGLLAAIGAAVVLVIGVTFDLAHGSRIAALVGVLIGVVFGLMAVIRSWQVTRYQRHFVSRWSGLK